MELVARRREVGDCQRRTRTAGRASRDELGRHVPLVFHPPSPFFTRVELQVELEDGHYHVPLLVVVSEFGCVTYRGQLSVEELGELFEGVRGSSSGWRSRSRPARHAARTLVHELPADEKREVLDAHPAIGQRTGLSARSAAEQGADEEPDVLAELARLNAAYEARHGFRFVVFVNRRPKHEILEVLRGADRQPDRRRAGDRAGRARRDRRR